MKHYLSLNIMGFRYFSFFTKLRLYTQKLTTFIFYQFNKQMASQLLIYLEERQANMIAYGHNTGTKVQWTGHWSTIIRQFQKLCAKIKGQKPNQIVEKLRNYLKHARSEWARTGENDTGTNFANWLKIPIRTCKQLIQAEKGEKKRKESQRKRSRSRDKKQKKNTSQKKKQKDQSEQNEASQSQEDEVSDFESQDEQSQDQNDD